MLRWLQTWWWGLQGALAGRRHRASLRQARAGSPVEERLTELGMEAEAGGIESLTARQQLMVRTWSARGVIDNGGFRFFLQGRQPLEPVAEGFRALGFPEAAAACERVMAAVAAGPALEEEGRRRAVLQALGSAAFGEENRAVFAVKWEALVAAIGRFMRANPRDFPDLPPARPTP